MTRLFRIPALLVTIFALDLSHAQCRGIQWFPRSWGDVITVTDMTRAGLEVTPPTPDAPVYFLGMSLGCKFGSLPGDRLPDVKEMNEFITKVLAKQGYLSALDGNHEPTLFVIVQWGYLQPRTGDLLWFLGYDADQDIGAPTSIGFLGPEVYRRNMRSRTIETILDTSKEAIYGIIVTGLEYKSASTDKPVIYWQTRIGLPANGKSMADALPNMILAAGPTIGRATRTPVLIDADDVYKGVVEIGGFSVIDNDEATAPAPDTSDTKK